MGTYPFSCCGLSRQINQSASEQVRKGRFSLVVCSCKKGEEEEEGEAEQRRVKAEALAVEQETEVAGVSLVVADKKQEQKQTRKRLLLFKWLNVTDRGGEEGKSRDRGNREETKTTEVRIMKLWR